MTPFVFDTAVRDIESDFEGGGYTLDVQLTCGLLLTDVRWRMLTGDGIVFTGKDAMPIYTSIEHVVWLRWHDADRAVLGE